MSVVNKLLRYYLTLKPLKWVQYYYLFKQRVFRVHNVNTFDKVAVVKWKRPFEFYSSKPLSLEEKWCFNFLGERGCIENNWSVKGLSKLWLYNLHYHDDLNKVESQHKDLVYQKLIEKWIEENPPLSGNGWEPYPLSLRIVNWVKWFSRQGSVENHVLSSLCSQADALEKQIEYHLQGNHLFENAKALVFFGAYIDSKQGAICMKKGVALLDKQVNEQFNSDGGHFEGSPMYHSAMMWGMCDLYLLAECSDLPVLRERLPLWKIVIEKGLDFLKAMSHSDGEVSFFNDSAIGIAPSYKDLERFANFLCIDGDSEKQCNEAASLRVQHFEDSGYIEVGLPNNGKAILDVANITPCYQPGHAHADTLSFELSLFGQRLFVNSGTSEYGNSQERLRQRGTASHNTVVVNGENSSDVWGGFRVGRRATVNIDEYQRNDGEFICVASHDGYRYLNGQPVHKRSWSFTPNSLSIKDEIVGGNFVVEFRLHIHPDIEVNKLNDKLLRLDLDGYNVFIETGQQKIRVEQSTWHPEFGKSIDNKVISVSLDDCPLITNIYWEKS